MDATTIWLIVIAVIVVALLLAAFIGAVIAAQQKTENKLQGKTAPFFPMPPHDRNVLLRGKNGEPTFVRVNKPKQPPINAPVHHPPAAAAGKTSGFKPLNGGHVEGKLCPVTYLPKEICTCPDHRK